MTSSGGDRRKPPPTTRGGRPKRRVLWALVIAGIVSLVTLAVFLWPRGRNIYTDANSIHEPTNTALVRDILWEPPTELKEVNGSLRDEFEPRLSADGMTLYFVRGKAGQNADIYVSERTPDGWTQALPVVAVNTEFDELGPQPSRDGRALYFYSDRPGGQGGYDLWVARRGRGPDARPDGASLDLPDQRSDFREAVNLGPHVNSRYNDYGPALTPDGTLLYFSSNRPAKANGETNDQDAWPATLREDIEHRTYDLYKAAVNEAGFGPAEPILALNTPYHEGAPAVSSFGDFIYFASDRPGGSGGFDLYRARRLAGGHEPASNLGTTINTQASELDPTLGMGGFALYFSSNRPVAGDTGHASSRYRLYRTTSREVFTRRESYRASLDWSAIWYAIGTNLLWALLALLLLLLLLAAARGARNRKLSLLARCLLVSLAVHLLLMLLFNVWEVTATLARELGRRGPIQIALIPQARGDDIVSQIRGEITNVDGLDPDFVETPQKPVQIQPEQHPNVAQVQVDRARVEFPQEVEALSRPHDATWTRPAAVPPNPNVQPPDKAIVKLSMKLPDEGPRSSNAEPTESSRETSPVQITLQRTSVPSQRAAQDEPVHFAALPVLEKSADIAKQEQPLPVMAESIADARPTTAVQPRFMDYAVPHNAPSLAVSLPEPSGQLQDKPEAESHPDRTPAKEIDVPRLNVATSAFQAAPDFQYEMAPAAKPNLAHEEPTEEPTPAALAVADAANAAPSMPMPGKSASAAPALPAMDIELPAMEVTPQVAEEGRMGTEAIAEVETGHRDASVYLAEESSFAAPVKSLDPGRPKVIPAPAPGEPLALLSIDARPPEVHGVPDAPLLNNSPPRAPPTSAFALPTEMSLPDDPYSQRAREDRLAIAKGMGGGEKSEEAVSRALDWLARHQSDDGHWSGSEFDASCGGCGGETDVVVDVAITGLSLLCYLGAGHTHANQGPYRGTVERGLNWLLNWEEPDGDFRKKETMYSQGIATIALAEAMGMSKDEHLRTPTSRAAHFIVAARNAHTGIWRYDPGQPGDTSVLGWQIMALTSASSAGISVPAEPLLTADRWLDRVSSPTESGLYAYQIGKEPTPSMTAEGLFIRELLGHRRDEPRAEESIALLLANPPVWDENPNTYYWYYATLALFHHQGEPWRQWNHSLLPVLLEHQHKTGKPSGSWDPVGEWAEVGGRVYQTALCTLMLEVYYRYLPLFLRQQPQDAIGTIRGLVTDASTGDPLAGATVRLDLPDRSPIEVISDSAGHYTLFPTEVPTFFALTASRDGYLPSSKNVATVQVRGSRLTLDFALEPKRNDIVALEAEPNVHHLGDDHFSGSINSQFQKQSEGRVYLASFSLPQEFSSHRWNGAFVTLLAKGVQMDHDIIINGSRLDDGLDRSPSDGSFREIEVPFDPALLVGGTNEFKIYAHARGDDIDDFEFVNVQIHLE